MQTNEPYDLLVIGAGQGGVPIAAELAGKGWRVALAERKYLGGSCVNFGCTPTKAAVASARVAQLARRGAEFGIQIPTVTVDFAAVIAGAGAIAKESRDGLEEVFGGDGKPELLRGHARIVGKEGDLFRVSIASGSGSETVTAKQVALDTGTRALIPPIPGIDTVPLITADNWLEHDVLPEQLVILGGGYIGLEMGQFYARMGSRVTIIDHGDQLAGHEEERVGKTLQPLLEAEGVTFHLGASVTKVAKTAHGVSVTVSGKNGDSEVHSSHLFVAVGRTPNTSDLGLETVGVAVDGKGIVTVDKRLATNIAGVWVIGDIRGGPAFTHTAWDDYRILLSQLTGDGLRTTDRIVPYGIFTDPQVGRVGLTEVEARKAGKTIKVGEFDMKHSGHAREFRETNGFLKVIVDAETDRILGATVVGDSAAELVHFYSLMMNAGAPYTVIRDAVIAHPTLCEAVQSATAAVG